MSDKSPEKIWNFESPEDLATALDSKNKTLAEKIRKISKDSIANNSKDLRKALQDELSDQEQKEIREALPDAWVSEVFTKWMTADEQMANAGKVALAWAIWKENAESIEKVEWLWNRVSTWIDKIWDIFDQKWAMAWFWAIIVMLKWIFSGDFTELDKILNPKKDDENAPNISQWREKNMDEKRKNAIYIAGTKLLLWFSKHKTDISYSIFQNKEIKTKTYEKLSIDNLDKSWLWEKYGLPGKDNEIFETLSILKERKDFINKTLGKKFPNWEKELTLEEIVLEYWKYWKSFDKIRWISINDLKSLKLPDDLFSFNKENNGTLDEILNERLQNETSKLKWVDKSFLVTLYSSNESKFDADIINWYPNSNKEFVADYIDFRNKIPAFISWNFFHGDSSAKDRFSQFFNNFNFTHKDILDLYIITNGDLTFEKLNDFQTGLIFLKVFDLLGKDNSWLRWETYLYAMREVIEWKSNEITNKIPQSVRETFLNIAKETWETILEWATWFLKDLWGALSPEQKAWTVAASILYIVGMIYLWRAIFAWKALWIWFLWWLGILATQNIYDYLSSNENTKAVLDKYKIKNGDDLWREFNKINP